MTLCSEQAVEQDIKTLPSPAHIAFAFIMVRSKPSQISIEDHLALLHAALIDRPADSSTPPAIDASIYWKNSYEKCETERLELIKEVSKLKQERDVPRIRDEPRQERRSTIGKRKRAPANNSQARSQPQHATRVFDDNEMDLNLDNLNLPQSERQVFLHGFLSLSHSIRLEDSDRTKIMAAICLMTSSVSRMLELPEKKKPRGSTGTEDGTINELYAVVSHVYPSVLRALEIVQTQNGDENDSSISGTGDIVKLFQAFLGRLYQISLNEQCRREQEARSRKRRARSDRRAPKPATERTVHSDEAKKLARVLVQMITVLNVSDDLHCELLEGFLCTLLDHLGSSLSYLVFADSQAAQKDPKGILVPKGLLDVAHLDFEAATETIGIESPYLIWVLRQASDFLHANVKLMSRKSLSLFSLQEPGTTDCAGQDLRRRIEETLQNTLLRGVFGDDDDSFYNSLRREVEEEDEEAEAGLAKILEDTKHQEDSPEWFIGQLWEYLGWDVLSGKRGV